MCTYNILSQKLLESQFTNGNSSIPFSNNLGLEKRQQKWIPGMTNGGKLSDIIALQEVLVEHFDYLMKEPEMASYQGILLQKDASRDGVALLWDSSKWDKTVSVNHAFSQPDLRICGNFAEQGMKKGKDGKVGDELRAWPQRAIFVRLKSKSTGLEVVAVASHLGADRTEAGRFLRAAQLAEIHAVLETHDGLQASAGTPLPFIIGMDQNDDNESPAYKWAEAHKLKNVYDATTVKTHNMLFEKATIPAAAHDFLYHEQSDSFKSTGVKVMSMDETIGDSKKARTEADADSSYNKGSDHASVIGLFSVGSSCEKPTS
jgi:mRNA deadenylase 3'-5' endonuclease subunit Ccr4